jgi:hypothetical protein
MQNQRKRNRHRWPIGIRLMIVCLLVVAPLTTECMSWLMPLPADMNPAIFAIPDDSPPIPLVREHSPPCRRPTAREYLISQERIQIPSTTTGVRINLPLIASTRASIVLSRGMVESGLFWESTDLQNRPLWGKRFWLIGIAHTTSSHCNSQLRPPCVVIHRLSLRLPTFVVTVFLLASALFVAVHPSIVRTKRLRQELCVYCGYDSRFGSSDICPECGNSAARD